MLFNYHIVILHVVLFTEMLNVAKSSVKEELTAQ